MLRVKDDECVGGVKVCGSIVGGLVLWVGS